MTTSRGFSKRWWIAAVLTAVTSARAATIAVTNTNDAGGGSLRAAIEFASPGDTIAFQIPAGAPGYDPNTGFFNITLTTQDETASGLVIAKNLTIDGTGSKIVVRRTGGAQFRIFNIKAGVVVLSHLTISGGSTLGAGSGGGILNSGQLTLRNCTVSGNVGMDEGGGALNNSNGSLRVENSTFTGNQSFYGAGAGGIHNRGFLFVFHSTIVGNTRGTSGTWAAGIHNQGNATIASTIIAGNTLNSGGANADVGGFVFSSTGYNIIGDPGTSVGFSAAKQDQIGKTLAEVKVGKLQDNGGSVPTMAPLFGSVAIDKGNRASDAAGQPLDRDQRDQPRPIDRGESNANGGDGSDVGAVEIGLPQTGPVFTVTTTREHDGDCTSDECTLVSALNTTNAVGDANTINFASNVTGVIGTSVLTPNGLAVTNPVTINGPGARVLTITGRFVARVFRVSGLNVIISGLSIVNGRVTADNGACIHNSGALTLNDCTVSSGLAATGGSGGGVYNALGSSLTLNGCTFNNNSAGTGAPGGNIHNAGILFASNTSILEGTAISGAGIYSEFANNASKVSLLNCTLTRNNATDMGTANGDGGGGLYLVGNSGQYDLANCIIAANTSQGGVNPDLRGNFTSKGHNLIGNVGFSTGLVDGVNGDQVGTPGSPKDPRMDPVRKNNGGPTDTHALFSDSTAINAGDDNLAPFSDQRGFSRVGLSDIGAFEFGSSAPGLVANVATRLPVRTGDGALFEGFIVQGPAGSSKKILVRGIGPSLSAFISDPVPNPTLEIFDKDQVKIASNDDWQTTQVGGIITGDQVAEINGSGLAPTNSFESAIIANLAPGNYTAVVRGAGNSVGTGIVDAYDLSAASTARVANIATRGLIQPNDGLMIAGFIIQNGPVKVVITALGPSLAPFGISDALPDTTLQLRNQSGTIVRQNDDWMTDQKAELEATGLKPTHQLEAALVETIGPGQYSAQVRGKPETTGTGVVQVFFLQ